MFNASFLPALAGGVLIGAAAVLLMLCNGRIAGISGMVRGVLALERPALAGQLLFLVALVAGAALVEHASGQLPQPRAGFPAWLLALAGGLVGLGTALARGCTSGHGVCGLARFSPRSLVAVLVFMATALVTTFAVRHLWGVT